MGVFGKGGNVGFFHSHCTAKKTRKMKKKIKNKKTGKSSGNSGLRTAPWESPRFPNRRKQEGKIKEIKKKQEEEGKGSRKRRKKKITKIGFKGKKIQLKKKKKIRI